jgi:hypothetical protein
MYSLAQAAKAAGKSKPTLLRAIRSGRLSATRHADGTYAIDPAELIRAFPLLPGAVPDLMKQTVPHNGVGYELGVLSEIEGLRALLAERDSRLADKDRAIDIAEATIADLRKRLDQATALLTDQRTPAPSARRWWNWRRRD